MTPNKRMTGWGRKRPSWSSGFTGSAAYLRSLARIRASGSCLKSSLRLSHIVLVSFEIGSISFRKPRLEHQGGFDFGVKDKLEHNGRLAPLCASDHDNAMLAHSRPDVVRFVVSVSDCQRNLFGAAQFF